MAVSIFKKLDEIYQAIASTPISNGNIANFGSLLDERGRLIRPQLQRLFPEISLFVTKKSSSISQEIHKAVSHYYRSNWLSKLWQRFTKPIGIYIQLDELLTLRRLRSQIKKEEYAEALRVYKRSSLRLGITIWDRLTESWRMQLQKEFNGAVVEQYTIMNRVGHRLVLKIFEGWLHERDKEELKEETKEQLDLLCMNFHNAMKGYEEVEGVAFGSLLTKLNKWSEFLMMYLKYLFRQDRPSVRELKDVEGIARRTGSLTTLLRSKEKITSLEWLVNDLRNRRENTASKQAKVLTRSEAVSQWMMSYCQTLTDFDIDEVIQLGQQSCSVQGNYISLYPGRSLWEKVEGWFKQIAIEKLKVVRNRMGRPLKTLELKVLYSDAVEFLDKIYDSSEYELLSEEKKEDLIKRFHQEYSQQKISFVNKAKMLQPALVKERELKGKQGLWSWLATFTLPTISKEWQERLVKLFEKIGHTNEKADKRIEAKEERFIWNLLDKCEKNNDEKTFMAYYLVFQQHKNNWQTARQQKGNEACREVTSVNERNHTESNSSAQTSSTDSSPRRSSQRNNESEMLRMPSDANQLRQHIQNIMQELQDKIQNKEVNDISLTCSYFKHLLAIEIRYLEAVCWGVIQTRESNEVVYNKVLVEATKICRNILLRYHPDKNPNLGVDKEIGALNTAFTDFKNILLDTLKKERRPTWINDTFYGEGERDFYNEDFMQGLRAKYQRADGELSTLWQEIKELMKEQKQLFAEWKKKLDEQDNKIDEQNNKIREQDNEIKEIRNKIKENGIALAEIREGLEKAKKLVDQENKRRGEKSESNLDDQKKQSEINGSFFTGTIRKEVKEEIKEKNGLLDENEEIKEKDDVVDQSEEDSMKFEKII